MKLMIYLNASSDSLFFYIKSKLKTFIAFLYRMKTAILLVSFILFCSYSDLFLPVGASEEPVLDAGGRNLRAEAYYYIVPAERGRGGGLTLSGIGNYTCPLAVIQDVYESRYGLPLRFYPHHGTRRGTIPVSTDMNIEFFYPERCGESTVWKLDDYDESTGKYFLGVGGVSGDTNPHALSNWFKIEKYGYGYKLVYCPSVCMDCEVVCKNVGIVYQDGQRRLALTDARPLKIIFKLVK